MRMCLMLSLVVLGCGSPQDSYVTAITHVTLIDGTGVDPARDVTVLVEGDEITAIGHSAYLDVPAGADEIDATGKYLIPGLWDMHVHVSHSLGGPEVLPVFLAYGVTGIRDVGSADSIASWARETASGVRPGPRILQAGPQIGAYTNFATEPRPNDVVRTVEDAQRHVGRRRGWADYIKLQDGFAPRDLWLAVAGAARDEGFLLAGHIPVTVPFQEALDAGLRSLEHVFGLPLAISDPVLGLRSRVMSVDGPQWTTMIAGDARVVASLTSAQIDRFSNQIIQAGAVLDPTLNEVFSFASAGTGLGEHDPRMTTVPEFVRESWRSTAAGMDSTYKSHLGTLRDAVPEIVERMHQKGVTMIAGSGAGTFFTFPGSGLHDELALLVKAGLSPMDAILAATRNPMILMGRSDSLGTIEVRKKADLVLLAGDPLEDISNTTRVADVWVSGRHYDRVRLDEMLETVSAQQSAR